MLNISPNSIQENIIVPRFEAFRKTALSSANRMFVRWLYITLGLILVFLFLPWTQNIQSKGKVTTLRPEQRPQTIHSTIAGRIERWYVTEGQQVKQGDTIVYMSEIKAEYFDPALVERTSRQVQAKEGAVGAYDQKISALNEQVGALQSELAFKQQQLQNKIQQVRLKIAADSVAFERAKIDLEIAERQLQRYETLNEKGIESLQEVENKRLKVQETKAKQVESANKLETSRNDLANAMLDLSSVRYSYNQKIAKAQSDKYSTLSSKYDAESTVDKLRIQSSNYEARSRFYYITAPQDAYITKALKPGIGETVKEGDPVVSIMPANYDLAVELNIKAMDLPLIHLGQEVRFIFDGWPALVFTGWPGQSFGTFKGQVVAIDNTISAAGKYRILVGPAPGTKPWPKALRPGSGANGIALLNDVSMWYEIWRQLNGFPPDYYQDENTEQIKLKAPVKSIK